MEHPVSPTKPTQPANALPSLLDGRKKENLMLMELGKLPLFELTLTFYSISMNQYSCGNIVKKYINATLKHMEHLTCYLT